MKPLLGLICAIGLLTACAKQEPTLDEFLLEFNATISEIDGVFAEIHNQPAPTRTNDLQRDLLALATAIRGDVAALDPLIAKLEVMKAPSEPPEANKMRELFLETVVIIRDEFIHMATALENGQPPSDSTQAGNMIFKNMGEMADLADGLGTDSTELRKFAEALKADFASGN